VELVALEEAVLIILEHGLVALEEAVLIISEHGLSIM
jgi:hypothetical protein